METKNWRNRIIKKAEVAPETLTANPRNWRTHPKFQQEALSDILDKVGWVQDIVVNERTGNIVDGHLRVELAVNRKERSIPVNYVDLSEDEERLILATFDPITYLANRDSQTLKTLLADIQTQGAETLDRLLERLKGLNSQAANSLRERFIIPPFTILDSRQGYWHKRQQAWHGLGIQSELGRDDQLLSGLENSATMANPMAKGKIKTSTSIFDPVLCELSYRWFCEPGGEILDPFAGGSVRGIVAAKLGYRYTGIDLRPEQCQANREQWEQINQDPQTDEAITPTWIEGDSEKTLDKVEEGKDLIFTCPPYFDLEQYSDDPNDLSNAENYSEFIKHYREIIKKSIKKLKPNRFAVFIVGDIRDEQGFYRGFITDTIKAAEDAGARLYNEAIYVQQLGTLPVRAGRAFQKGRKLGKTHQNLLAFFKGEPGEAEFGALAEAAEMRRLESVHHKMLVFANGEPPELGESVEAGDPFDNNPPE